ncbi:MAG: DKNYY domain-containing protein [Chloroflexota bacterium]
MATVFYGGLFLLWFVAVAFMLLQDVTPELAGGLWIFIALYPLVTIGSLFVSHMWQRQRRFQASLTILLLPFLTVLATLAAFLGRVGQLPLPGDQISNCYYIADREVRVQYYAPLPETAVRNREIHTVPEGHPRTFEPLPYEGESCGPEAEYYGVDRNHVYHRLEIVTGADPRSFEILSHGYTRDANHVFFFRPEAGVNLTEVDPRTIEVLEDGYARDALHDYYNGEPIADTP